MLDEGWTCTVNALACTSEALEPEEVDETKLSELSLLRLDELGVACLVGLVRYLLDLPLWLVRDLRLRLLLRRDGTGRSSLLLNKRLPSWSSWEGPELSRSSCSPFREKQTWPAGPSIQQGLKREHEGELEL